MNCETECCYKCANQRGCMDRCELVRHKGPGSDECIAHVKTDLSKHCEKFATRLVGETMIIQVDVSETKIQDLVKQRIDELFSVDGRYRDTGVREVLNRIVDEVAINAVRKAQLSIESSLPELAVAAVRRETQAAIEGAARRGISALKKLYAGFDPSKLTADQREWLETQITTAAKKKEA